VSVEKRPSRRPLPRDMDATPFTPILDRMIGRIPGAYGAVLVDSEGETVDYAGLVVPYEIRVAAAYLQISMRQLEDVEHLGQPKFMIVRGSKRTVIARALPEAYVLGLLLRRRAGFNASPRAFSEAERALAREAGWSAPSGRAWYTVEVKVDRRGRPVRVEPDMPVEVLGTVMGLSVREQGFRVRTAAGLELTLVREARHTWYADEELDAPPRERKARKG
jgi:hypothetical protein